MAKFEHHRYPALGVHDGRRRLARFTPEERRVGQARATIGVLETDDKNVIAAVRRHMKRDKDLVEVDAPAKRAPAKKTAAKKAAEPEPVEQPDA